jgi:hypothetical protein
MQRRRLILAALLALSALGACNTKTTADRSGTELADTSPTPEPPFGMTPAPGTELADPPPTPEPPFGLTPAPGTGPSDTPPTPEPPLGLTPAPGTPQVTPGAEAP